MKVIAVTALVMATEKKNRTRLVYAGTKLDIPSGDVLDRFLELGAVKEADDDGEPAGDATEQIKAVAAEQGITGSGEDGNGGGSETPSADGLPKRPGNGAATQVWANYLTELERITDDLGPIEVPEGAKRDDLIRLGDARVQEWNEEKAGAES